MEVTAAAQTYVFEMDGIKTRRKRMIWDAPTGMPVKQSFPGLVVHFLSKGFKDPSLLEM